MNIIKLRKLWSHSNNYAVRFALDAPATGQIIDRLFFFSVCCHLETVLFPCATQTHSDNNPNICTTFAFTMSSSSWSSSSLSSLYCKYSVATGRPNDRPLYMCFSNISNALCSAPVFMLSSCQWRCSMFHICSALGLRSPLFLWICLGGVFFLCIDRSVTLTGQCRWRRRCSMCNRIRNAQCIQQQSVQLMEEEYKIRSNCTKPTQNTIAIINKCTKH